MMPRREAINVNTKESRVKEAAKALAMAKNLKRKKRRRKRKKRLILMDSIDKKYTRKLGWGDM